MHQRGPSAVANLVPAESSPRERRARPYALIALSALAHVLFLAVAARSTPPPPAAASAPRGAVRVLRAEATTDHGEPALRFVGYSDAFLRPPR